MPQYNKRTLGDTLAGAGICYLFLGEQLGGKPPRGAVAAPRDYATRVRQEAFQDGIEQLLAALPGRLGLFDETEGAALERAYDCWW